MNSLMDDLKTLEGGSQAMELPAKRTFVVVMLGRDDLLVESHAFMVEESGALSFVEYVLLRVAGREMLVPQKHEAIDTWDRVYERKELQVTSRLLN